MKTNSLRRLAAVLCVAGMAMFAGTASAEPVIDQNLGTWVDLYNDSNGIAPVATSVGGQAGQNGVIRDPIARNVSIGVNASSGYWFSSEIAPASFDAWKSLYIDYNASAAGDVQVEVWNVTNGGASATRVLGPVSPGPSDDPSYTGKISIASVPATATRLRVRISLTAGGAIPPTVSAIKATFNPRSVLQASIETTPSTTRPAGDVINVRMPVSVSFVNATSYVAYATQVGVLDDRYGQNPTLAFESATLGGQYTATGITVSGVAVPARSVYWSLSSQEAGKTYAYNASFRSPNGLVRGIAFTFRGAVHAANAATVQTNTITTRIESKPATSLEKNASGTFIFGGEHYADMNTAVTFIVSPMNWWNQVIPPGAQTLFQPVVWDSFQDFITQGVVAGSPGDGTNGFISNISNGGRVGPATVRGISIPANAVYWELADLTPSQRLDLRYTIQLTTDPSDSGKIINGSCPANPEAHLATPQLPVTGFNACAAGECVQRNACLKLHIDLDESPGFSFGKGDEINGSFAIRTNYDDNPDAFVTIGQPINFKLAVGNSGLSRLDHVVVYDLVKTGWKLLSASVPSGPSGPPPAPGAATPIAAYGRVYYAPNTNTPTAPSLYTTPGTIDTSAGWTTTVPAANADNFWVAYEIDSLRSSYCSNDPSSAFDNCTGYEPTGVTLDFSILPESNFPECTVSHPVENTAEVRVYEYVTRDDEVITLAPARATDWEVVNIKPLRPNVSTSYGAGSPSVEPGMTATHTFYIQNTDPQRNPIDVARLAQVWFTRPTVKVNGVDTRLEAIAITSNGGTVTESYGAGEINVSWPILLTNLPRVVSITYAVPTGIKQGTNFTTNGRFEAAPDCGDVWVNVSASTTVFSEPELDVDKDLDYRVVDTNTTVTYTLSYQNTGTAPAEKTWVIDRIENGTRLLRAKADVGEVWYSSHIPPFDVNNPTTQGLPNALNPAFVFTDAVVRAHFQKATSPDFDGYYQAPANAKWVAFLVDNPSVDGVAVSPPLFPTGLAQRAYIQVDVVDPNAIGQLIVNEALIDSDVLPNSIGERVSFIVSPDPGVAVAKSCNDVASNGEEVTYTIDIRNDTTNNDDTTVVEDTFPAGFEFAAAHVFIEGVEVPVATVWDANDANKASWTFAGANVLRPTQSGQIVITGVLDGYGSGDRPTNQVLATATNPINTQAFFDDCTTLIQNTDLSTSKLVSNAEPRSGESIVYTVSLTNNNLRAADNVVLEDLLPTTTTPGNVANPLINIREITLVTPGWQFVDINGAVVVAPTSLTGLRFQKIGSPAGTIPGALTPTTVRFSFRADVNPNVGPGQLITNRVDVVTTTGEECLCLTPNWNGVGICPNPEIPAPKCTGKPNLSSVDVKTPWPDPYVQISSSTNVKPGEVATWTVNYGNLSVETSRPTAVYFTMPDGPNAATPNQADFSFASVNVPPGAVAYYSSAPLNTRQPFDPASPTSNGWSTTPPATVNHIAFLVQHCDPSAQQTCQPGDIFSQSGPFTVTIKATAREPVTGNLPGIGGSFTGCADIGITNDGPPANGVNDDNDYSNNGIYPAASGNTARPAQCATVVTPGVGLEVATTCEPGGVLPGLPPGDTMTFAFTATNNGTTPDYGVKLTATLDPRLDYVTDTATTVVVVDRSGALVTPIGPNGVRVAAAPMWTKVGNAYWLGAPNTTSFGLAPGDSTTITVTARVKPEVTDSTGLTNSVEGIVTPRAGLDEPEVRVTGPNDDNVDSCSTNVYRADVFVIKHITNTVREPIACGCEEGFEPNPTNEFCVGTTTVAPTNSQTTYAVCAGSNQPTAYSWQGARFHSSFNPGLRASDQTACAPSELCVLDQSPEWIRRLNNIGVWNCPAGTATPIGEWIGFSKCIDIPGSGDYLVGIAGDNHVLMRVDGEQIYQSQSDLNFRTWNVFKLSLTAGTHIIELFGKNDGSAASFGAEIAGPFAPGTIDTPQQMSEADYIGNLVFSTSTLRAQAGQFFQTSLSGQSGLSCPAGFALDLCGEAPTCTQREEAACSNVDEQGAPIDSDVVKTYADAGDRLRVTVEYGNNGHYEARDVVMTDSLVDGLIFVANSVRNIPAGAELDYQGADGSWGYVPTSPKDPNVRGIRIVYPDGVSMPAPASGVFTQTSVSDFDLGTYSGTYGNSDYQAVMLGLGENDGCREVDACKGYYDPQVPVAGDANAAAAATNYQQCLAGNFVPEGECCQQCCPDAKTVASCEANILFCLRQGNSADFCEAQYGRFEDCQPEQCENRTDCNAEKYPEPGSCYGAGYYQPEGQCNRACCPPAKGTDSYLQWSRECIQRAEAAIAEWGRCEANCGPQPPGSKESCEVTPAECAVGVTTEGTYTSPVFPTEDDGNVLEWGFLIVNATFDENATADENFTVGVYSGNQLLTSYKLDDGTGTYEFDLREAGIEPDDYPELQLRAFMEGGGTGQCMVDIAPSYAGFWGMPTGLNENNTIIGIQRNNNTRIDNNAANLAAWYWNDGNTNVTDLHGALPTANGRGDRWRVWDQSVASDVNDAGTIVGWADPADDTYSNNVDTNCTYPMSPTYYEPYWADGGNSPSTGVVADSRVVDPGRMQWVVQPGQAGYLNAIRIRDLGPTGSKALQGATIIVGYANSTTLSSNFNSNWRQGYNRIYLSDGGLPEGWTTTADTLDFDYELRPGAQGGQPVSNFYYYPPNGPLLIEISRQDRTIQPQWETGVDCWLNNDDENRTIAGGGSNDVNAQLGWSCPIATEVEFRETQVPIESAIVWSPGPVGAYVGKCLQVPAGSLHDDVPSRDFLDLPQQSLVYINQQGTIAASAGASRTFYEADQQADAGALASANRTTPFGTLTVWMPDGNGPLYPQPVTVRMADYYWQTPSLLPPVALTGLSNDSNQTLIGVMAEDDNCGGGTASAGACGWNFKGMAWGYMGRSSSTGELYHKPYDLGEALYYSQSYYEYTWRADREREYPEQVIPLDIDDAGNIIGVFHPRNITSEASVSSGYIPVQWTRVYNFDGSFYYEATVLEDAFDYGNDAVGTGALSQMINVIDDSSGIAFSATASIDDNRTYFTTDAGDGISYAWANYLDQPRMLADDFSEAVVTGAYRTTALGIGSNNDLGTIAAFADFGGEYVDLGSVTPGLPAIPLFANDNERVVGTHLVAGGSGRNGTPRVFKWDRCAQPSDAPRLEDWTVTYRSDRNPAWSFEVELADICTQSLSNQADITTSTPEITLDNNSSRAEMVVNSADLAVETSLSAQVVATDDNITVDSIVTNYGPGSARNIIVEVRPPEGCDIRTSSINNPNALQYSVLSEDPVSGAVRLAITRMDPNDSLYSTFTCTNTIDEPGLELTAAIAVSSPTIDCVPDNDANAQGVIVGEYPNLWVTVSGPTSTSVGAETPYILTFGNNGNDDSNGTIVVELPAGTSFTCGQTPCATGYTTTVTQPTPTTPGSVVFVPGTPGFPSGLIKIVPFTLTWNGCDASNATAEIQAEAIPAQGRIDASISDNAALASTLVTAPTGALTLHVDRSDTSAEDEHEVLYTFHYSNNGNAAAIGTWLSFVMPTGVVIDAIIPDTNEGASIDVGRGTLKSLLPDDTGSVVVRARVTGPVGAPGLATLNAGAGACGVTAPIVAPTLQPTDTGVHVVVSPSVGSTCAGEGPIDWTVTVTNPSATATVNTPVAVQIPAGLTYVPGSIRGQGGIDVRAPELLWLASIPRYGAVSFSYRTTTTTDVAGVLFTSASYGQATGSGSVVIDCDERVTVTKSWDLTCGVANDTFDVSIVVTNGTDEVVSGTIYDTFQNGVVFGDGIYTQAVTNLLPGKSYKATFSFTVTNPLLFADPIFNRAVFDSVRTGQVASNQVAGAVLDCGQPAQCQTFACEPLVGCAVAPIGPLDTPELCNNQLDDDCDGQTNEGFELIGQACDGEDGDKCQLGTWVCDPEGNSTLDCNETQHVTEVCDGRDNDCDGLADETWTRGGEGATGEFFIGDACDSNGNDSDLCKNDIYRCAPDDNTTIACAEVVPPQTEACNGIDDNCNQQTDETYLVAPFNLTQACDGNDGDRCNDGVFVCNPLDDNSTVCLETGTPKVEICDGADNDCDDLTDEDFPTVGQACDSNTSDGDLCRNDIIICNVANRATTICQQVVAPQVERCNGIDDNCNQQIDETFVGGFWKLGEACDGNDGDACNEGVFVCAGNQNGTTCNDNSTTNGELCNGVDDNCNGQTDEDWKVGNTAGFTGVPSGLSGTPRFLGQGCDGSNDQDRCEQGVIECGADFTTVYCHETGLGLVELCDVAGTVDENCDGAINEGFDLGGACMTDELGVCRTAGVLTCASDDNSTTTCVDATPVTASAEVCNGLDDNCNGITDEAAQGQPAICGPIETDIVTGPPAITASTTATFTYVNPLSVPVPAHTTFECSLDGGVWTTCNHVGATPSLTYANLPAGPHTLLVRATRADGAVDPTPDFWTWVIDTTVPDTTIVAAPTNPSQNPNGSFAFGSPTPNPDFYSCVLDPQGGVCPPTGAGSYGVCANPYAFTNLADGRHTMCVYVTNTAGTPDPTPATYTWTIDTTAPETEIVTVIPPKVTGETTVVFNYIDPTAPATNTFECSLDGSAWTDCDGKTETYTNLTEGEHVFEVRTVDPNGVVDPTPATYTFIVDLTAPCPTIALQPANPSQSGTAIFGFTASEADVTYFCALDAQLVGGQPAQSAYVACPATATFSNLADGNHTLWVYAVDVAGNIGTCRDDYAWLIDSRFPETEITDGPTPLVGSGEEVTLDYIDPTDEDLITFECSLDGAVFTRCDGTVPGDGGTIDYGDLPVGQHTFEVRACDFTKAPPVQCDPTPATWTWQVTVSTCPNDRTAPAIACAGDVVLECVDGGATVDLDDLTPTATDSCNAVTSTSANGEVVLGQSPLVFTSTDGNGNVSSCVTLVTVSDTAAPTISCPADLLSATTDPGLCSADLDIAAATGNDACQGTVGLLSLNDAPTAFAPGETVVTHHLIDAFGNETTCAQTVVVTDDEPLVLTCSESATVDADADKCEWTGKHSALATDNCSDELTIDVEGTYPVGVSPILFTAADGAGNSDECTTQLTVRDVTDPTVACGTPIGALPTVIRATASDACGTQVTLENVACVRVVDGVESPVALTNCPININGDTIEITGRLSEGELVITYDARAVDPSGNFAVTSCEQAYDPDQDNDGVIDAEDNCVATVNGDQTDSDDDGIGNLCDICPDTADADQADRDDDGVGDACSDKDKDGVLDIVDNCEVIANGDQLDIDGDKMGDVCDPAPYEGLTAEGDGGCASGGGAGSVFGGLLGLLGIFMAFRARRR